MLWFDCCALQDAKVIQVRWNKGSLTAPYPRIFLRAVPFMPSTNWAVGSFLVSLISLNILSAAKGATLPKLADKVAAVAAAPGTTGQEGLLGGALHILLAGVDSILDNAVGLLGALASPVLGIAETVGAAIGEVLLPFLGVSGGSDVLGFSLLLAANVWVVSGIVRAVLAHPTHWLKDVQSVILGAGVSRDWSSLGSSGLHMLSMASCPEWHSSIMAVWLGCITGRFHKPGVAGDKHSSGSMGTDPGCLCNCAQR